MLYVVVACGLVAWFVMSSLPVESEQVKSERVVTPVVMKQQDANLIIEGVNNYRVSKGLGALAVNQMLNESACLKADDMLTNQYWDHVSPTGVMPWYWFDQVGYAYAKAGENLANGYEDEKGTVDAWINSPSHEENMVGDYNEIGVCVRLGHLLGRQTNLVVNHFGRQ